MDFNSSEGQDPRQGSTARSGTLRKPEVLHGVLACRVALEIETRPEYASKEARKAAEQLSKPSPAKRD
jgi:hypothetical protein